MGNLAARLLRSGATDPGASAILTDEKTFTFGEIAELTSRVRGGLIEAGVGRGDRVGLLLSGPRFVDAYLAVLGVGAVAVPLNLLAPAAEQERALAHTGTELVITSGPAGSVAIGTTAEVIETDALADHAPGPEPLDVDDHEPAALMMTSGTTGAPRAAILTHGSLRANLDQLHSHPGMRAVDGDVGLAILPLFHVFGLNVALGYSLYSGTTMAFPSSHGAEAWLEAVARFGVTVVLGTPQLFAGWAELAGDGSELDSLRVAASGAAPLDPETFEAFRSTFGKPLWEGYGLTEASPVVSTTRMDPEPTLGSVGRPLPGVEVELRGSDGEIVLLGDPGEVWVRGGNVFAGYWDDPKGTAEAIVDGWLKTGDVAVADEDGRLFLVDRSRDIVIVSGFNVFPAEVEEILNSHPHVGESAVVGRHSERTGEEVVAYLVAASRDADGDEIKAYCAERLSRYKVPVEVKIVDSLPHTLLGKVRRSAIE